MIRVGLRLYTLINKEFLIPHLKQEKNVLEKKKVCFKSPLKKCFLSFKKNIIIFLDYKRLLHEVKFHIKVYIYTHFC